MDRAATKSGVKRAEFEKRLGSFVPSCGTSVDQRVAELMAYVHEEALATFGSAAQRPSKSWITPRTWTSLASVPKARRHLHAMRKNASVARMGVALTAWRAALAPSFSLGMGLAIRGWAARDAFVEKATVVAQAQAQATIAYKQLIDPQGLRQAHGGGGPQ